jgi:hypothetical protein
MNLSNSLEWRTNMNKTMIKTMLMFALAILGGSVWAEGESFSIGFDNSYEGGSYTGDTLYGWEGAQVAGKKWNNTDGASIYNMRLNTGVQVDDANFIVVSKGGGYRYYSRSSRRCSCGSYCKLGCNDAR